MGWKAFLARVAVLCLALGVTMRVAMARDGEPGGRARSFVTIAGTVTGVAAGDTMMRFTFRRTVSVDGGVMEERCVRDVSVPVDAAGTFAAVVPLVVPGSVCEANFFDGSDVRVDVSIGGVMVVDGGLVNPVPYAIHADTAATATTAATAVVASQYGTPDCPLGYTRATDPTFTGEMRLCQRRRADGTVFDEVVRVGVGSTAFWIDRYEASVWASTEGTGMQYGGAGVDNVPATFPQNGQWTAPLYASSRAGVRPSLLTWFQASEACRVVGARLPNSTEWLTAGRGTPDPGASNGSGGLCNTMSSGLRNTGEGTLCRSAWGVEDMIGNIMEMTEEWYPGVGGGGGAVPWPAGYNGDGTYNVASRIILPGGTRTAVPAIAWRGGSYGDGTLAGLFYMDLDYSPAYFGFGFRCVRTR